MQTPRDDDWVELEESGGFVGVTMRYRIAVSALSDEDQRVLAALEATGRVTEAAPTARKGPAQRLTVVRGATRVTLDIEQCDPDDAERLASSIRECPVRADRA